VARPNRALDPSPAASVLERTLYAPEYPFGSAGRSSAWFGRAASAGRSNGWFGRGRLRGEVECVVWPGPPPRGGRMGGLAGAGASAPPRWTSARPASPANRPAWPGPCQTKHPRTTCAVCHRPRNSPRLACYAGRVWPPSGGRRGPDPGKSPRPRREFETIDSAAVRVLTWGSASAPPALRGVAIS
jgi:hypothetical protein